MHSLRVMFARNRPTVDDDASQLSVVAAVLLPDFVQPIDRVGQSVVADRTLDSVLDRDLVEDDLVFESRRPGQLFGYAQHVREARIGRRVDDGRLVAEVDRTDESGRVGGILRTTHTHKQWGSEETCGSSRHARSYYIYLIPDA